MKYLFSFFLFLTCLCRASFGEPADSKAYLQMIYENKGGYIIPSEESEAILKEGGHPQYGEIPYDSLAHILDDLNLSSDDVFYVLGCGVGKGVLQAYLTTPIKRSIGIELSQTRWNIAESCRKQMVADGHLVSGRDVGFINQNILTANLSDATVYFINGITFPPLLIQTLMKRLSWLAHEVKVINVLPLPPHQQFQLLKIYQLPMSWAPEGVDVYLYKVIPIAQVDTFNKLDQHKKRRKKQKQPVTE